ncbi:5-formyltetrahydrofolate cyclo-ligase-like [Zootermopsis nevadensis]|uniref:5-formyltetrahydrofolate cyclo-ligase n=1 Tax=Zootermopsis nevadensis TaxID=136037 RepID=A0A067QIW7_ZOONE|nr:5-formyltetrahydrofolate cyclo-ligase-like [Zootermopsis nevadensis]KDR08646.1 5-formyltetrahydrofolate cyclo-ligase [Zootermopsis nevadensis]
MEIKTRKKSLRKELNIVVNSLPQEEIKRQSKILSQQVLQHPQYIDARSVSIYLSFDKEIQTAEILEDIFRSGKTCFIPRFCVGTSEMEMIKLHSLDDYDNLPMNKWNIKQPPDDDNERISIFDTENLDLVLIPGLAFTKNGKRLGRGKGYYDRFLAKCFRKFKTRPFTLGLAFREQIVSAIPTTDTDVIIDQVLCIDD